MELHASLDLAYGQHPAQRFDLFVPDGATGALTIAFHGGWFTSGSHQELRLLGLHLASHGVACATIGLRALHSDGAHNGDEVLADAKAGTLRALEEAGLHGCDGASLITLGSGSGSLIALVLAHRLAAEPGLRVRGCAGLGVSPSLEHGDGMPTPLLKVVDLFAGTNRHGLSPTHLKPAGYPPLLLLHGDDDTDLPAKTVHRFHLRQVEQGEHSNYAVIPGAGHQFIEQVDTKPARTALERLVPWLVDHARPTGQVPMFAGRGTV